MCIVQKTQKLKEGFLTQSTALGLRVTISSTLSLIEYLSKVGYKYILTSRLNQDKVENLFGIVRQSCGSNDHPTPSEFLNVIQCLSFYNLAKPPRTGNASPEVISALINTSDLKVSETSTIPKTVSIQAKIDSLIDFGNLSEAREVINE